MAIISKSLKKKIVDAGLEFFTKSSRALGRLSISTSVDNVDWEREEYEAYRAIFQDVWIYVCINIVATNAAMLPVGAFKRQPKTQGSEYLYQEDHWLTNLLEEPNPQQTKNEFIEATAWSLRLSGQYFHEKVGPGGALKLGERPTELYVLDPRQVRVIPDPKNYVKRYDVNVGGIWTPFQPWEISWGKHTNPSNIYEGLSPNTPAGNSINANIAAGKYATMFFRNGGMPIGTMESDRRLGEPDYARIRANWNKSAKGIRNWFKLLILEGGLKFKAIQETPRNLALIELKKQLQMEIFAAHGVPMSMAGDSKSVNYASAKEFQKMFWRGTETPVLQLIAGRFTKDMLSKEERANGKIKVMFDATGVDALQEDQEIKSRIAFNLYKGLTMTPDQIRKYLYKMQPHDGGFGAHLYLPSNMVTAEALINNGGKPLQGQGVGGDGKPGKPGGPNAQPGDEGSKPGANDGKPAKEFKEFNEYYRDTVLIG